jgi:CheY-like chemotaxis protein/anti-sigma regulatory factor (Ser/Thr protein kinase)
VTNAQHSRHRVLIIDDEEGPSVALKFSLEPEFEVTTATGVFEALPLVVRHRFSVIITDVRMPECDGIHGAAIIRVLDPDVPIIVVTGYKTRETAQQALLAGASMCIGKPWDIVDMQEKVRESVRRYVLRTGGRHRDVSPSSISSIPPIRHYETDVNAILRATVHDTNNAHAAIAARLSIISDRLEKSDAINEQILAIRSSFKQCSNNLKTMRLVIEGSNVQRFETDLTTLIEQIVSNFKPLLKEGVELNFRTSLRKQASSLTAPEIIQSVVTELIRNSVDAIGVGPGFVTLSLISTDDAFEIRVSDTGPGISATRTESLFQRPQAGLSKGGWGLYLARISLAQVDAKIEMTSNSATQSDPEVAFDRANLPLTTFTITLPRKT